MKWIKKIICKIIGHTKNAKMMLGHDWADETGKSFVSSEMYYCGRCLKTLSYRLL